MTVGFWPMEPPLVPEFLALLGKAFPDLDEFPGRNSVELIYNFFYSDLLVNFLITFSFDFINGISLKTANFSS